MRDYDNDDLNPVEVRGSEMKMGGCSDERL
jgi:hypothetical protein